jgi:hypothetical protein
MFWEKRKTNQGRPAVLHELRLSFIKVCLASGMNIEQTAEAAQMSISLVLKYVNDCPEALDLYPWLKQTREQAAFRKQVRQEIGVRSNIITNLLKRGYTLEQIRERGRKEFVVIETACPGCGAIYPSKSKMRVHRQTDKCFAPPNGTPVKTRWCVDCGLKFSRPLRVSGSVRCNLCLVAYKQHASEKESIPTEEKERQRRKAALDRYYLKRDEMNKRRVANKAVLREKRKAILGTGYNNVSRDRAIKL